MDLIRQIAAVVFVLSLLFLAARWLRKNRPAFGLAGFTAGGRAGRRMTNIERLPLDPHHILHLVRVDGKEILLAVHAQGCTVVEAGVWSQGSTLSRGAAS